MISIGRLSKEKNWKFLLRAAARAMQKYPALRVVLLGDGPERTNLEQFTRDLGIRSKVDFIGFVDYEEVPDYLDAADFFGFASTSETQGLVTMEAMAAGLPVVAVDASGTRDIVQDGVHGFLVDQDIEAFAQAIDQLLSNRNLYHDFQRAASAQAKKYEIMTQAKQLLEIYQQAFEDKSKGQFVRVR